MTKNTSARLSRHVCTCLLGLPRLFSLLPKRDIQKLSRLYRPRLDVVQNPLDNRCRCIFVCLYQPHGLCVFCMSTVCSTIVYKCFLPRALVKFLAAALPDRLMGLVAFARYEIIIQDNHKRYAVFYWLTLNRESSRLH